MPGKSWEGRVKTKARKKKKKLNGMIIEEVRRTSKVSRESVI